MVSIWWVSQVDPLGWSHFGDPLGWSCFLVDPLGLTWWIHLGLTSYWIHLGLTCWIPLGWSHLVPSVGEEPSETNKMDRLAGSWHIIQWWSWIMTLFHKWDNKVEFLGEGRGSSWGRCGETCPLWRVSWRGCILAWLYLDMAVSELRWVSWHGCILAWLYLNSDG